VLNDLIYRLRALVRHQRVEDELQEELQYHLEREAEKYRERGSSSDTALRRARLAMGGPEQVRQLCREARGTRLIEDLLQDLYFAARQLRKNFGFAATAIAVFAVGIAASTAIYAFVDAALVKPLPYRNATRLVALYERIPVGDRYHLSYLDYRAWKQRNRVFASLDVYRPDPVTLTGRVERKKRPERWSAMASSELWVLPHFLGATFGLAKMNRQRRRPSCSATRPGGDDLAETGMWWGKRPFLMATHF
jgi:anti-sigma factor RsiW